MRPVGRNRANEDADWLDGMKCGGAGLWSL
jgi:hypothetical protein